MICLVMGVAGCGKSTVGALLARSLHCAFADADTFHSPDNIAKMAAGIALTDDDRGPWLQAIRAWIDERAVMHEPAVVACSALKRRYRDLLRRPEVTVVYLRGTRAQIEQRLAARHGHFFEPELLESQLAALEEPSADEQVITVSIDGTPEEIVASVSELFISQRRRR